MINKIVMLTFISLLMMDTQLKSSAEAEVVGTRPFIELEVFGYRGQERLGFDRPFVKVGFYPGKATVRDLYAEVAQQTGMETNQFVLQAVGRRLPIELSASGHQRLSKLGKSYFNIKAVEALR